MAEESKYVESSVIMDAFAKQSSSNPFIAKNFFSDEAVQFVEDAKKSFEQSNPRSRQPVVKLVDFSYAEMVLDINGASGNNEKRDILSKYIERKNDFDDSAPGEFSLEYSPTEISNIADNRRRFGMRPERELEEIPAEETPEIIDLPTDDGAATEPESGNSHTEEGHAAKAEKLAREEYEESLAKAKSRVAERTNEEPELVTMAEVEEKIAAAEARVEVAKEQAKIALAETLEKVQGLAGDVVAARNSLAQQVLTTAKDLAGNVVNSAIKTGPVVADYLAANEAAKNTANKAAEKITAKAMASISQEKPEPLGAHASDIVKNAVENPAQPKQEKPALVLSKRQEEFKELLDENGKVKSDVAGYTEPQLAGIQSYIDGDIIKKAPVIDTGDGVLPPKDGSLMTITEEMLPEKPAALVSTSATINKSEIAGQLAMLLDGNDKNDLDVVDFFKDKGVDIKRPDTPLIVTSKASAELGAEFVKLSKSEGGFTAEKQDEFMKFAKETLEKGVVTDRAGVIDDVKHDPSLDPTQINKDLNNIVEKGVTAQK